MTAYPKTYQVRITRHGDDEVFVTYNDSTGRYDSGRRIARGADVSDLPRYVRDELSEWSWGDLRLIESTTTEGHPGSRHAEHVAGEHADFVDMDCRACTAEWAEIAGGTTEVWTTTIVTVETPRGTRYQGVCHVGEGMPKFGKLPRNAQVRYTTRLHKSANEAREQARSRTIHHNLWHDGTADAAVMKHHRGIRCAEGSVQS